MSNTDMKIGSNKDINKDHKKLAVTPPDDDVPKIVIPAVRLDNSNMLTEKHNDEKLVITLLIVRAGLIVRVGLIGYYFLVENEWHYYYFQSVVLW